MNSQQSDATVFSLRIVTIDYYTAPPIPNLDFSYSAFQGRKVEEVPVIRIYGTTPAGQKACLHIHGALPYLYIPCPDEALQNAKEAHTFAHLLSSALEKALRNKNGATSKRQHIYECCLVQAKKLYGYHSSENLFIKIYLYYPHEVARVAALLLEGSVLNKSFQPYESHIPYLLQFVIDYNLYGMSHIHTSKVKFRPPVPDVCTSRIACLNKHDLQAHGNLAVWLSSTVPSASVWPVSVTGVDDMEDKTIHLITRQSTCSLEVDSSVDDIVNEKNKMYASLSQTGSEVKMVQSLVPIWEEYERSGTAEAVKSPDLCRPLPENVLGSFLHGLEYDKALAELCKEIEKISQCKVSAIEGDKELDKFIESFTNTGKAFVIQDHQSPSSIVGEPLKCSEEQNENVPLQRRFSFQENKVSASYEKMHEFLGLKSSSTTTLLGTHNTTEAESPDTEALGLLSWLASSQAVEEFTADDELLHEAILSPLLPAKSYREAVEIAHLDYENASQQECQDILDSVQGFSKSDRQKEHSGSAARDSALDVSSANVIPQVDGSSDDDYRTPLKSDILEVNMASRKDISFVHQVERCTGGSKYTRSKLLQGPLPFPIKQKENETAFFNMSHDEEIKNDGQSCPSSGSKRDRCHDDFEMDAGEEIPGVIGRQLVATCSVRDLMRKKRCFRAEHQKSEVLKDEKMGLCSEGSVHRTVDSEICHMFPEKNCNVESSSADQDAEVGEEVICTTASRHEACSRGYGFLSTDNCRLVNKKSVLSLVRDQVRQLIKSPEPSQARHVSAALCSTFLGGCKDEMPDSSQSFMKSCNKRLSFESEVFPSCAHRGLESNQCERQSVKYRGGQGDDRAQEGLPYCHSDRCAGKNVQQCEDCVSGVWDVRIGSLNSDLVIGKNLQKGEDEDIGMTFSRKAPTKDEVDTPSEDSSGFTGHVDDGDRQRMNDLLPFFTTNVEDGNIFLNDEEVIFRQESALGVPTHFQNDGSVLYLLTHAVSPPSPECIRQWLFKDTQIHLSDAVGDAYDRISPESNAACHLKSDLPSSTQENTKLFMTGNNSRHTDIISKERHGSSIHVDEDPLNKHGRDTSQISGVEREEKANLTPLSQIGFRDPASIGGGQQLTSISLEVLAESRGDLRPDPRVDAINVLSLVIEEDTTPFEVYVFMCDSNEEPFGRIIDGVPDCKFVICNEEKHLLEQFVSIVSSVDPDILMGWEIQGGSLGFLAERAAHLGISLLKKISRTPAYGTKTRGGNLANPESSTMHHEALIADAIVEDSIIEDEWGRLHASGIHVGGRIVLNIWRLMRAELKLNMHSLEAVAEEVLRRKIPSISCRVLNHWFSSGPAHARYRCIEYIIGRAMLNLQIMNQLDMINRTSELARVFGIDFFSVLSRGSQYRVESMLLRLAHTQNYLAISPGHQQVASQPAMECLPLVMEPESGFYADPVVVLDFQALYPSMIIAYNLCFSTCLGSVVPAKANVLGVSSYLPDPLLLKDLNKLLLAPNGIMYVPSKVRKGVLPRLLEEILSTRIMVKQAMKKLMPSQQVLKRIFNARQLALKLIANVTYGYTAAGFSGRMPCAELADSIVQCGRRTLETAITFVNQHDKWKARVVYGDTDSMFVLLRGRSREEAFRIGNEIASAITAMNPHPVTLKMEKVYHPCFLLTKKRYVGYSYENPDQKEPTFDAKGIETIRRDKCPAVAKTLERSIRLLFEHQDISVVKRYLQRQWTRILSGRISLQDFVFAKEVRLGTYSARAAALPPAAVVATKAMRMDPRAEPRYGERVCYVVIHGEPGARLVDMVVDPSDLLDINSPYRLNELYYISKQIIPALQRVFGLVGADLNQWFSELPRPVRPTLAKRQYNAGSLQECDDDSRQETSRKAQVNGRIDTYYISKHCTLCGEFAQASDHLCDSCSKKGTFVATAVIGKASKLEREIQHLAAICRHCGGGDWVTESGVKCTSLACSVFYERRKVQKELKAISSFATGAGYYPSCTAEWF